MRPVRARCAFSSDWEMEFMSDGTEQITGFRAELARSGDPERFLEADPQAEQAPLGAGRADQRHAHGQPAG